MEQLVNFIIRPPRADYSPKNDLLDAEFILKGRWYQRKDLEVTNGRGNVLRCSHYLPLSIPQGTTYPCVIYCHGNSGCRADASEAAIILLPSNITVFTLDFSGSGLSEGEHVTLGWNEKEDLKAVVDHLRTDGNVSCIGLWGRSMGAVTSLMYGAEDPSIAGMVLDSPFSNLVELMMELVDTYKYPLPKFTVRLAIQHMRKIIKKKANFDIMNLDTIQVAKCCFVPALLGHATDDDFIHPHHSDRIYDSYVGDKNIIKFDGDHNSPRPQFYFDSITIFFHNVLNPPANVFGDYYHRTMHDYLDKDSWNAIRELEFRSNDSIESPSELAASSTEDAINQLRSRRPMSRMEVPPDIPSRQTQPGVEGNSSDNDFNPSSSSRLISFELSNGHSHNPLIATETNDQYLEYSFDSLPDVPCSLEDEERMVMEAVMMSLKDMEVQHPPGNAQQDTEEAHHLRRPSDDIKATAKEPSEALEPISSSISAKNGIELAVDTTVIHPVSSSSRSINTSSSSDVVSTSSQSTCTASSSTQGTDTMEGTSAKLVVQQKNSTGGILDGLVHRWGANFFRNNR